MGFHGSKNFEFFFISLGEKRPPARLQPTLSGTCIWVQVHSRKGHSEGSLQHREGAVFPCPMAQAFPHPCKVTPMKLSREGELPGVPGEEGLTGRLVLCRNNLRPRMMLSSSRKDFSLRA